jgi:hypothetical protein
LHWTEFVVAQVLKNAMGWVKIEEETLYVLAVCRQTRIMSSLIFGAGLSCIMCNYKGMQNNIM